MFSNRIRMVDDLPVTQTDFLVSPENGSGSLTPGIHLLTKLGAALNEFQNSEDLQQKFLEIILRLYTGRTGAVP